MLGLRALCHLRPDLVACRPDRRSDTAEQFLWLRPEGFSHRSNCRSGYMLDGSVPTGMHEPNGVVGSVVDEYRDAVGDGDRQSHTLLVGNQGVDFRQSVAIIKRATSPFVARYRADAGAV